MLGVASTMLQHEVWRVPIGWRAISHVRVGAVPPSKVSLYKLQRGHFGYAHKGPST